MAKDPIEQLHFYSYDSKVLSRYRLFRSKLGMHVRHTSFIRQKVKLFVQNKELGLCPLVLLDAYMYTIMCKKIKFEAWRVKMQRYLLNKRVRLGHWLSADKSKDTCNISFVIDRPKKKPFKVFELVKPLKWACVFAPAPCFLCFNFVAYFSNLFVSSASFVPLYLLHFLKRKMCTNGMRKWGLVTNFYCGDWLILLTNSSLHDGFWMFLRIMKLISRWYKDWVVLPTFCCCGYRSS